MMDECRVCLHGMCEDCCDSCSVKFPECWMKVERDWERKVMK